MNAGETSHQLGRHGFQSPSPAMALANQGRARGFPPGSRAHNTIREPLDLCGVLSSHALPARRTLRLNPCGFPVASSPQGRPHQSRQSFHVCPVHAANIAGVRAGFTLQPESLRNDR